MTNNHQKVNNFVGTDIAMKQLELLRILKTENRSVAGLTEIRKKDLKNREYLKALLIKN